MVVVLDGGWYGPRMDTTTLHQNRALTCGAASGFHVCIEAAGHEALGLTHIASDGTEWAPEDLDAGYVPTRLHAGMALAS